MSAESTKLRHPKTYDYSDPKLECDIIMKGGITSGVIYPWAVCELAKTYRFKCVGGTSAGAIAAAASAAAEYGRGVGGFEILAELPDSLGAVQSNGQPKLLSLFQPQERSRALFRTLISGLGKKGLRRWATYAASVVRWFWLPAVFGALLGVAFIALALHLGGLLGWLGALAGLVLLVAGAVAGGVVGLALRAVSALPPNGYGMCRGIAASGSGGEEMTPWLDRMIATASGVEGDPLTFGMLWEGPDGSGDAKGKVIQLEMMTTDVTEGLPSQLPADAASYFFHPDELLAYFPEHIVEWMKRNPASLDALKPAERCAHEVRRWQLRPLLPMPDAANLPVVVATRMSLSFPVLISAVPLHAIDWSLKCNDEMDLAVEAWLKVHPEATADEVIANLPDMKYTATKHWFSDGGLCSNFPVHLFDAPLPSRPTFALNLRGFHHDNLNPQTEAEKVYLPTGNRGGHQRWQTELSEVGLGGLTGFFGALIKTMQNWQDNSQLTQAGYRDRIVHVSLSGEEGGMNLRMDEKKIALLANRGRLAATKLVGQFAGPKPGLEPTWGWTNHRWTRYRVALAELQPWLSKFTVRFTAPSTPDTPGYIAMVQPGALPESHGFEWYDGLQPAACKAVGDLVEFAEDWPRPRVDLTQGAPVTRPTIRLVWRPGKRN